jgi:uncharacterized membrane protein YdjX (TVP38/TMEM64 family)
MKTLSGAMVGLAVLASPLVFALPIEDWLNQGENVRAWLAALGLAGPWMFTGITALAVAFGLPRLAFCTLAGGMFGFTWGFICSQLGSLFGSLFGAYFMFLLARRSPPERVLKRFPQLTALSVPAGRGWWTVLLVRQFPIAGLYNDILLGWSPASHRDFWIGSFLGFLPLGVAATLMGAGALQADLRRMGGYWALAAGLFLLLNLSLKWTVARKTG